MNANILTHSFFIATHGHSHFSQVGKERWELLAFLKIKITVFKKMGEGRCRCCCITYQTRVTLFAVTNVVSQNERVKKDPYQVCSVLYTVSECSTTSSSIDFHFLHPLLSSHKATF